MQRQTGGGHLLSATDVAGHLGCRRLTQLSRALANGEIAQPPYYDDPLLEALRERGRRHERAFVDHCAGLGLTIADLREEPRETAQAATLAAMQNGADIIVQAAFSDGLWRGYPDVLRRTSLKSDLGAWSYEVIDTKLAREAKASAVLQVALYSQLLARFQGAVPEYMYIVTPGEPFEEIAFRVDDFGAYLRWAQKDLAAAVEAPAVNIYPDPKPHCDLCGWSQDCEKRRRDDDHLSFVAGIGRSHILELQERSVTTLAAFAHLPLPLPWKPERGARETYTKLREQARVQLEARECGKPVYELLPLQPGLGLGALPAPSKGDIFLDFEGDSYVGQAGLEYLLGYVFVNESGAPEYVAHWALDAEQEKAAFERFIDFAIARRERYPDLHIYHYNHYEPSALKRLMGRYATRESELDSLLRGERFVDLLRVVRHGVRCGVESYSIKKLEPFYQFDRDAALPDVNRSIARFQAALELGDSLADLGDDCDVVQRYNADDCHSTAGLRDWLETLRAAAIKNGADIARPEVKPGDPSEAISDLDREIALISEHLCTGVPADAQARTPEQQARWVLAQCLGWHRREWKVSIWEKFRLHDLTPEELTDERKAISGLSLEGLVAESRTGIPTHRYSFPPQETDIREEADVYAAGGDKLGTVAAISPEDGWVEIKKMGKTAGDHPEAVFEYDDVRTDVLAAAVKRIALAIAAGDNSAHEYRAAWALLTRAPLTKPPLIRKSETPNEAAIRLALSGAAGVLPIQGPPGAGKTFTGAEMIAALAKAGKRIGVTANSHRVINHLISKALEAAELAGVELECVQKTDQDFDARDGLTYLDDNDGALNALDDDVQLVGGTAWFWAREAVAASVDVLFVDEAAQMSLANVLAVSHAAPLLVLLGDPQQLEQPSKASHPEGSDASALHHVLGDAKTMPAEQGLFLPETYRLHPKICAFTSEVFYEGRLNPLKTLKRQTVTASPALGGAGLRYLPVQHEGRDNCSPEEAEAVRKLVRALLRGKPTWTNRHNVTVPLTRDNILIVAPYNAQVAELKRLMPNAKIGTVDKFQGQEEPVVIYSMTSSSSVDAPRGMEFLYSLNRLNVATSRAQALCFVVATPAIFEPDCGSPRQMQLVNALCRYRELATEVSLG